MVKKALILQRNADSEEEYPAEYDAQRIVGKRTKGNAVEYLVKWEGYPSSDNTWEPLAHLENILDLIEEYELRAERKKKIQKQGGRKDIKSLTTPLKGNKGDCNSYLYQEKDAKVKDSARNLENKPLSSQKQPGTVLLDQLLERKNESQLFQVEIVRSSSLQKSNNNQNYLDRNMSSPGKLTIPLFNPVSSPQNKAPHIPNSRLQQSQVQDKTESRCLKQKEVRNSKGEGESRGDKGGQERAIVIQQESNHQKGPSNFQQNSNVSQILKQPNQSNKSKESSSQPIQAMITENQMEPIEQSSSQSQIYNFSSHSNPAGTQPHPIPQVITLSSQSQNNFPGKQSFSQISDESRVSHPSPNVEIIILSEPNNMATSNLSDCTQTVPITEVKVLAEDQIISDTLRQNTFDERELIPVYPDYYVPPGELNLQQYVRGCESKLAKGKILSIQSVLVNVQIQDQHKKTSSNHMIGLDSLKDSPEVMLKLLQSILQFR